MNKLYTEDYLVDAFRKILEQYGEDISADEYDALDIDKPGRATIRRHIGPWRDAKRIVMNDAELDMIRAENVRLAKERQKYMDTSRIERKSWREHARIENAVGELNKELIDVLNENNLSKYTNNHPKTSTDNACGIIHASDWHANELINLKINKYDFTIASKRARKLIRKAKQYFSTANVNNVLFAMTGDMTNAESILDKLLNEATNRSKALFLTVQILEQMILELNEDYNVTIACVTGNEGRMQRDIGWSDILVTDNYDFAIFNILRYLFKGSEGIKFIEQDNYLEQIVNVAGKNILLIHGHQINSKVEHSVQQIKGRFAAHGVIVDYILYGHLHSARMGNTYGRSASLCGSNAYSEQGLMLTSRASQNIYIVYDKDNMDGIVVDLQDISNEIGYDINKELESYNAKSSDKLREHKTVFEVVI